MGNFLIQVYGPCVLLVVLSWVSFWLNREATADRISLGITTVLTMTFLGLEARTDLPKVPYPTALDFFVFLSFGFIFATIIQFAVVHYFTKYGSGECYFSSELDSDSSSDEDDWPPRRDGRRKTIDIMNDQLGQLPSTKEGNPSRLLEVIPLSACRISSPPSTRNIEAQPWSTASACLGRSPPTGIQEESQPHEIAETYQPSASTVHRLSIHEQRRRRKRRTPRYNSVSKIDRASRVVFPFCFIAINVFYWVSYLKRSERIHQSN